jgi:hypothetical protein
VFYIHGRYGARLPVGDYSLIAAKGPEYLIEEQRFVVTADQISSVKVTMKLWGDMAAKGWYSGDNHIHYSRESAQDNGNLLRFAEAEDLHVARVLQYGNSGNTYLGQYDWNIVTGGPEHSYALIPGQEDPRTGRRGHAIELHMTKPIRDPSRYLLYHEVLQQARAQGAILGYAHLDDSDSEMHHARRGLAIDVPFGLVDFMEVLQFGEANTRTWFEFLNLGYKVTPSAGADYPYGSVVGAERNYVHLEKGFTAHAWLQGFKEGHTFVTNGPMLEFHLNGQEMGSQVQVARGDALVIESRAALDPSISPLDRLELIEQGEVIKTVVASSRSASELRLRHEMAADHGTWFVVRAMGKHQNALATPIALSAPIYVSVDGQSFWKPSAVPAIVAQLRHELREVLKPPSEQLQVETWDAQDQDPKYWQAQEPFLRRRVEEANLLYDRLVRDAEQVTH